jgi:tricorn protease
LPPPARLHLLAGMRVILASILHLPFVGLLCAASTPMSLLYAPALTPDGASFAFEWDDDLWLASTDTGEAKRILSTPGRDMFPRITPDGKRIVFTSDAPGSPQVFSRDLHGGEITQHTFHTEGCQLECLSPDGTHAIIRGLRDRSGYKPWRLMTLSLIQNTREALLFDAAAHTPSWTRDGQRILFCRGGELPYRQGFRGARASRIWSYHQANQSFTCEVPGDFEARSPLALPDGSGFYFVSNQHGVANLWSKRWGHPPQPMTFHKDDGVLTPDLSNDGSTLLYRHGFELLKINPQRPTEPSVIRVFTEEVPADRTQESVTIRGCRDADFASEPQRVVCSEAGELWLIPHAGASPQRLTSTTCAEEEPCFSKDGTHLFFFRDDGLTTRLLRARIEGDALTDVTERAATTHGMSQLKLSPEGTHIAWIESRGDIRVARTDGGPPWTAFPCWDQPTFDWSPDGRWLAVAAEDCHANRDIHLVPVHHDAPTVNLTRHPAFDGSPLWSPDGRRLVFTSKRNPSGTASLWCIDLGKAGMPATPSAAWLHARADAARELPIRDMEPRRVIWSQNPERLYFQSRKSTPPRLYQFDFHDGRTTSVAESSGIPIRVDRHGTLLWRIRGVPHLLDHGHQSIAFPIAASIERPRSDFLRLGFRRIWRTLGERFHDASMNGRDWHEIRRKYEDHASASRTSREFDHIVGRLAGELNASHLVFQRQPWSGETMPRTLRPRTLHTGIRFENPSGGELRIREVIHGAPISQSPHPPQPGEVVLRIAGQPVHDHTPIESFLTGDSGMKVPMVLRDARGTERTLSVRCISYAHARTLDAKARQGRAAMESKRNHCAYLQLADMSRDSLETFQLFLHRNAEDHQALILDLRDNGGGREANRMLSCLEEVMPLVTRPRNGPEGYPLHRLASIPWPHPVAVLCNQNTYSNSEIFCHAYLAANRGPLIGSSTAGGVISAVMTNITGLGKLQVPFRTWMLPHSGTSLDLHGAQPTHSIDLTPEDEHKGLDPQLQQAIRLLAATAAGAAD